MRCVDCKYHKEWKTDFEFVNECLKFGFSYYSEFCEEECPYMSDKYEVTKEGEKLLKGVF